ncbi:MAG: hypothetical protein V7739_02965 [Motiliproteus sp.]
MSVGLISFIAFDIVALIVCIGLIYSLLRARKTDASASFDSAPESDQNLQKFDASDQEQATLNVADALSEERNLVSELRAGLEKKARMLSELKDSVKSQLSNLLQAKQHSAAETSQANSPLFDQKMDELVNQTKHSNQLISELRSDFEANRQQLDTLDEKLAKKAPSVHKVRQLVEKHKMLKEQNQQLMSQIKEYMVSGDTQESLIAELQQKVDSADPTAANFVATPALQPDIEKLQSTLIRTLREKEFIEAHYLKIAESLPEAEEIKQELSRAKKELLMLEEHIVSQDKEQMFGDDSKAGD